MESIMSAPITTKQKEVLERLEKIMQEAVVDYNNKGFRAKAIKNLQAGLIALTNVINKIKKEDVPVELYNMQAKMATEVSVWSHAVKEDITTSKVGSEKRLEQTKVKAEILFRDSAAKKVVGDFVTALKGHKGVTSVALLVSELESNSKKFKSGDMSFKEYKDACMKSVDAHKKHNHAIYYKQPHGLFQHITNTLRVMMRLLEKMFNFVTGYQSSIFKKADSSLGKEAKEFHVALEALKAYEPEAQNAPAPAKA